ncbi:MAG: N-acetylglucosamine-specific PTS transporter subunit IIBC [Eubacteriales bacterium]
MMKYLQKLGKSLMLPVATLPVASILMGIGYWIDPTGWGANSIIALLLIKSGGILIDNMALLFAVGVAVGMSVDQEGTSGLAGLVSWLTITTMLSSEVVATIVGGDANPAFDKIATQFVGILAGIIGATSYNKFHKVKLHDALGFFNGRRCVAIVSVLASLVVCIPLYFIWPTVYDALVTFGEWILGLGAVGAGIYGFLNRLLIPVGLHHALNSVFWFDVAGVNDIGKFWGSIDGGVYGETGQYMTGFFPMMMFGLPAAALAMYHTAKTKNRKIVAGILMSASLSSFFTGITEPLEFAFMFLAPGLYFIHAVLTGLSCFVVALLPTRAGFNFSAGFVDWFLSFNAPYAQNPLLLIPIGLVVGVIYYVVFRFAIQTFDLKTPGREDDQEAEQVLVLGNRDYAGLAKELLEGLGGADNIATAENCITRLRIEVKDRLAVDEKKLKATGIAGVIRPGKNSVQIIIGTKVQFVADEFKRLL